MLGIHSTHRISHLGKYTAHNDYPEEEVRRISNAAAIFVSAATLEMGGALPSGRVTHAVAYNPEDHDAQEERERERRERERRGERDRAGMTTARMAAMGGQGGGGGGRTLRRRNSSGCWRWWTCGSRTKTGTMVATAGAAMAVVATAATGTGPTLSSLHSLVMLSKRPLELVQRMAPCRGEREGAWMTTTRIAAMGGQGLGGGGQTRGTHPNANFPKIKGGLADPLPLTP